VKRTDTCSKEIFEQRCAAARHGRHVRVRPSKEPGMADLVAHLPAEQPIACAAALRRAVEDEWGAA